MSFRSKGLGVKRGHIPGEYMKRFLTLILITIWAPLSLADICGDRVIRMANPIFPSDLNAVHVLNKEKQCSVDVAYSINMDGRSENIESRVEREICRVFKVSAMRAYRSSQFQPGEYLHLCYGRVTFRLENGQLKWEFGQIPGMPNP